MAIDDSGYTVINKLVGNIQAEEDRFARKANTVTTAIGAIATMLAAGLTELIQSGNSTPSWLPLVTVFVGLVATTFSVSKTQNGMTDSVAEKLERELNKEIDQNHYVPTWSDLQTPPLENVEFTEEDAWELRREADDIINRL